MTPTAENTIVARSELVPTHHWNPKEVKALEKLWLPHLDIVKLEDGRWSHQIVLEDGKLNPINVFSTRAGAIRAAAAGRIRYARDRHRTPRDRYDTNPAFDMSAMHLRIFVGWIRDIVAREAPRTQAAIERYEGAVEKSRAGIAAREEKRGVAGMEPGDFRYPAKRAEARAKVSEFETILAKLKEPIAETTAPAEPERQVISKARVASHGEVMTARREVDAMLDLVPDEASRIESRFLEPACGNGNFLVAILEWKLASVTGKTIGACESQMLTALSSIYAIDIQKDNVETSRHRLLEMISECHVRRMGSRWIRDCFMKDALKVVEANIVHGDFLTMTSPPGAGEIEWTEWDWPAPIETPKTTRKVSRQAPDPITDTDRATAIVMRALKAVGRPGAPLPILRVVAAHLTAQPDGAEAEVTMFDGLNARFECERIGREPDAWKTRWSRMEGGDIELVDGAWRRVPEVVEDEPEPVEETVTSTGHAARLVAAGIVPVGEHLRLYGLPAYAGQIPAPSRRYRFPVTYDHATDRCYLVDEALRSHARVVEIENAIGEPLAVADEDVHSFSGRHGKWHHAIDLMTDEHFAHLLDSQHLTTDDLIERAVALSLSGPGPKGARSGGVSLANARHVLAAIGVAEPEDRSRSVLADQKRVTIGRNSEGPCVNWNGGGFGWAFVHGLEDGYLKRGRSGFVEPTDLLQRLQSGENQTSSTLIEAA